MDLKVKVRWWWQLLTVVWARELSCCSDWLAMVMSCCKGLGQLAWWVGGVWQSQAVGGKAPSSLQRSPYSELAEQTQLVRHFAWSVFGDHTRVWSSWSESVVHTGQIGPNGGKKYGLAGFCWATTLKSGESEGRYGRGRFWCEVSHQSRPRPCQKFCQSPKNLVPEG